MNGANVEVLGCTAVTPVGLTIETASAAVRAGISRVGEHPSLLDRKGKPVTSAQVESVSGTRAGVRATRLAEAPFARVIEPLSASLGPVPVLLALPEPRPGWGDNDDREVLRSLNQVAVQQGLPITPRCVARGHAGSLQALQTAITLIEQGAVTACVVGGVDSYLDAQTLGWLDTQRRRRAEYVRSGFVPGEAAAFVLLGGPALRHQLRCATLARIRGVHVAEEPSTILGEDEVLGKGLASAISGAARESVTASNLIDDIYCDINGERYRSDEWGFALLATQQWMRDGTQYAAPADCWGDVGAASGPLMIGLATQAWQREHARGDLAMVWASSDRGLRGATVIEKGGRQ